MWWHETLLSYESPRWTFGKNNSDIKKIIRAYVLEFKDNWDVKGPRQLEGYELI